MMKWAFYDDKQVGLGLKVRINGIKKKKKKKTGEVGADGHSISCRCSRRDQVKAPFPRNYSWGSNTEHWNTEHSGMPNVLKFCFPMV